MSLVMDEEVWHFGGRATPAAYRSASASLGPGGWLLLNRRPEGADPENAPANERCAACRLGIYGAVKEFSNACGIEKSAVSENFIEASREKVRQLMEGRWTNSGCAWC